MRTALHLIWKGWRISLAILLVLAAGTGLLSAWLTPRGPIITAQALASMKGALVVGVAAGLEMGSRWSMLITPAIYMLDFELVRLGVVGPTADGIHSV